MEGWMLSEARCPLNVGLLQSSIFNSRRGKWEMWLRVSLTLRCLALGQHLNFLDGCIADGSVGLAPGPDASFTGTHWEIVNPVTDDPQTLESGFLVSGLPLGGSVHIVMRRNGDFTWSSHAHDSGFDNINYVISAALRMPSGMAFTFQRSGHVEGTVAGLPFGRSVRDDNSDTAPLFASMERWMRAERGRLSRHADVAKAMNYTNRPMN
jgi:hypothetical protein